MSVLIIGGGPAGLALAGQLHQRKMEYLLIERAPHLGNTFRSMAGGTRLGPWVNNVLPTSRAGWQVALRRARSEEYAQYLSEYAIQRNLEYVTSVSVERVFREDNRFRVATNQGDFYARVVVNATGYFSNPYLPEIPGMGECQVRRLHAADYRDPDTVRQILGGNRGKVLVVGHRTTAGEVLEGLYRAGFHVCLSHRSPIRYALPDMMQACISPVSYLLEEALVHLPGLPAPLSLESRMPSGPPRQLLEWGLVHRYPAIRRFQAHSVEFVDGAEDLFDLVVFATGYRPALAHLAHLVWMDPDTGLPALYGTESRDVPGLFFLGLQGLRSFRSQFLRGIREDALYLADWLERYWAAA